MPINTTNITTQLEDQELTTNLNYLQPTGFKLLIDRVKYPNLEYFTKVNFAKKKVDPYDLVAQCIKRVYVGTEDSGEFTFKEARDWVEGLTNSQFSMIQKFFNTMPTLRHTLKVTNPKTKKVNDITIEGLADFFA